MRVLGAVLDGGRSSRFGNDKAKAHFRGVPLIEHALAGLAPSCDAIVIVGGDRGVPDWPAPDAGPLGGIAGALNHASANGFDAVLTCGVDSIGLPADLRERLSPPPSYVAHQPVVGLWPVGAARAIEAILSGNGKHSVWAFARAINALGITLDSSLANVNTPADLAALERRDGV